MGLLGRGIPGLFDLIFSVERQERKERAKNSDLSKFKKFGIESIIFTCVAIVGTYLFNLLGYKLIVYGFTTNLVIIGNIIVIVFGATLFLIPLYLSVHSILYAFAQRRMNPGKLSKAAMWISVIGIFATVILTIIVVMYFVGVLGAQAGKR